jgi:hypothetical protein
MRHPAHVPAEPEHDLVELLKKMRYDLTQLPLPAHYQAIEQRSEA